jgi:hypothetical protein
MLLSNPKRKLDSSKLPNTVKSEALPVKKQRVTRKEKAGKILSEIPDIKSIKFDPIKMSEPQAPILLLPSSVNAQKPLNLFSLFFTDAIWDTIARNTNTYADRKRFGISLTETRPWTPTHANEIHIFIGIIIYMGLFREPSIKGYWRQNPADGPLHIIHEYISLIRFQQIKRYLHISPCYIGYPHVPDPLDKELDEAEEAKYDIEHLGKIWWRKLEPLISEFRSASERYYQPSTNISIDELIIRCHGRSSHTYKMPNKPINQGYKLYALADHGYIWTFTPSSRALGLLEVIKHKDLTQTGSMVLQLLRRLHPRLDYYTIYLDNYFTSISLFDILRQRRIGACSTTRPKNAGPDWPELLTRLKDEAYNLPWNTIYTIPLEDKKVLCFAWQDNNIVLGMTTVHSIHRTEDLRKRERKHPSKTSTNAHLMKEVFGDSFTKELEIPSFIDDYNHHMGGVDITNQLRASYETHHPTFHTWWPLFLWIIDAAVVNAYQISCVNAQHSNQPKPTQLQFRRELFKALFQYRTEPTYQPKRRAARIDLPDSQIRLDSSLEHVKERRPEKLRTRCTWCLHTNYMRQRGTICQRILEASLTNWNCKACKVPLCGPNAKRTCWIDFHSYVDSES